MTDKKRNLIIRTLTGIVFVAILVGGILWSWMSFTILFMLITALSIKEFCDIINQKEDVQVNTMICTVAGTYLFGAISGFCSQLTSSAVFIPYLLSIVYLLVSELYQDRQYALNNWAFTMFSQMYIALPFGTLNAWRSKMTRPALSVWSIKAFCLCLSFCFYGAVTAEPIVSVRFSANANFFQAYLPTNHGKVLLEVELSHWPYHRF